MAKMLTMGGQCDADLATHEVQKTDGFLFFSLNHFPFFSSAPFTKLQAAQFYYDPLQCSGSLFDFSSKSFPGPAAPNSTSLLGPQGHGMMGFLSESAPASLRTSLDNAGPGPGPRPWTVGPSDSEPMPIQYHYHVPESSTSDLYAAATAPFLDPSSSAAPGPASASTAAALEQLSLDLQLQQIQLQLQLLQLEQQAQAQGQHSAGLVTPPRTSGLLNFGPTATPGLVSGSDQSPATHPPAHGALSPSLGLPTPPYGSLPSSPSAALQDRVAAASAAAAKRQQQLQAARAGSLGQLGGTGASVMRGNAHAAGTASATLAQASLPPLPRGLPKPSTGSSTASAVTSATTKSQCHGGSPSPGGHAGPSLDPACLNPQSTLVGLGLGPGSAGDPSPSQPLSPTLSPVDVGLSAPADVRGQGLRTVPASGAGSPLPHPIKTRAGGSGGTGPGSSPCGSPFAAAAPAAAFSASAPPRGALPRTGGGSAGGASHAHGPGAGGQKLGRRSGNAGAAAVNSPGLVGLALDPIPTYASSGSPTAVNATASASASASALAALGLGLALSGLHVPPELEPADVVDCPPVRASLPVHESLKRMTAQVDLDEFLKDL